MSVIINVRLTTLLEARELDEQFRFSPGKGCIRPATSTRTSDFYLWILSKLLILPIMTSSLPYFCDTPVGLVDVLRRLHTDFKLKFTLETLEASINYYAGVHQQGDNMVPVLFMFLVPAVMESLHLPWDDPDSDLTIRPI
jgi:hypothetical protein